ncbi:D-serine/D-alanine/glycine transporter [compost metagenome]
MVLTSAASSANSGVFSTSRMLFGLAQQGDAPRSFEHLSSRKVPANGLYFSCTCLLLGAALMYVIPDLIEAFTLVTTVSAILFMFVWTLILLSYLSFRKNRPALHQASKYKMPGGRLMCYVCLTFFAFILVLLSLESDTRQALIVTPLWFVLLAVTYQFVRRNRQQLAAQQN